MLNLEKPDNINIKLVTIAAAFVMSLLMTLLPSGFGMIGAQTASAADPRGDWYTQYQVTRNSAQTTCDNPVNTKKQSP